MSFCQYTNILGAPGEGIHAWHIAGFAANDMIMTIIAAIVIGAAYGKSSGIVAFIILIILSIVLHWIFCVKTQTNQLLNIV